MGIYLKIFILLSFFTSLIAGGNITPKDNLGSTDIAYDVIVVHGMKLKGRIVKIGSKRLSFHLIYCDGVNHIKYEDIDSIVTKYKYQISYNRKEIVGRVLGIEDNKKFLEVELNEEIIEVEISDIDNFVMSVQDNDSIENRIRNRLPYNSGNMHIGLEFEDGTNDKVKTDIMMNWWHKKAGNELHLYLDYAHETTTTEETDKTVNKDELTAILTNRYFYNDNGFIFGSMMGEFDRPRNIQSRYVPAIGYGYNFKINKHNFIEPIIGIAYISTKYTDINLYPKDTFMGALLGLNGEYEFDDLSVINKLIVDGKILYYPSFSYPKSNWIWRSSINFTIPLLNFISMKLAIAWINDSNPDPRVGNNKTTTNLLFGIDF